MKLHQAEVVCFISYWEIIDRLPHKTELQNLMRTEHDSHTLRIGQQSPLSADLLLEAALLYIMHAHTHTHTYIHMRQNNNTSTHTHTLHTHSLTHSLL